jgi:hypothetical protein
MSPKMKIKKITKGTRKKKIKKKKQSAKENHNK